jgi:molybdopterin synthase catalytic subunit
MRVEVIAFAALREALGQPRFTLELSGEATARTVRDRLVEEHPRFADLIRSCRLASGVEFVDESAPLTDGAEVVLIPPVSGGSGERAGSTGTADTVPSVVLNTDPLDGDRIRRAVHRDSAGAVVLFEGTVRSPSEGRDVHHLEYEAYEAMAVAQMEKIVEEARARWPLTAACLHHRLGRIEVGEVSVVAAVTSPHRPEAFEACRWIIEQLKADVPIWKKEFFADGSVWVGAPGECSH